MSELKIYGHDPTTTAWGTPTPQREPKLKVTVNWSTRIVQNHRTGTEYRTPLITEPRYEIEGSDFILTDESFATLSQAFQDTCGRALAFPFKNPIDCYCRGEGEVFSEGISQTGFIIPINATQGQIVKRYSVDEVNTYKTILHPIASTVVIYDGETLIASGYTVNEETGIVDFAGGIPGWLVCSCEYRMRFRFDVSDLQLTQIKRELDEYDRNVYQSINFKLIEDTTISITPFIFPRDWNSPILNDFADAPLGNVTIATRTLARIESSQSLLEQRESVTGKERRHILESDNGNRNEAQRCLTHFIAAKGKLVEFLFKCFPSHYETDSLTIEQLGVNAFSIGATPLKSIRFLSESIIEDDMTPKYPWSLYRIAGSGDEYLQSTHYFQGGKLYARTNFGTGVIAYWLRSPASYIPQEAGLNLFLEVSIDARKADGASGQLFWFVVIQCGHAYRFKPAVTVSSTEVSTITQSGLLTDLGISYEVGSPIFVGLEFGNSTGSPGQFTLCEYDNFTAEITVV